MKRKTPIERFLSFVEKTDTCWLWKGHTDRGGYGKFHTHKDGQWTSVLAHRFAFEHYKRSLQYGETVDHLCFIQACVNPDHLDACSNSENVRRANEHRTHCHNGHPYDDKNTMYLKEGNGKIRRCRICTMEKNRRASQKYKLRRPV